MSFFETLSFLIWYPNFNDLFESLWNSNKNSYFLFLSYIYFRWTLVLGTPPLATLKDMNSTSKNFSPNLQQHMSKKTQFSSCQKSSFIISVRAMTKLCREKWVSAVEKMTNYKVSHLLFLAGQCKLECEDKCELPFLKFS